MCLQIRCPDWRSLFAETVPYSGSELSSELPSSLKVYCTRLSMAFVYGECHHALCLRFWPSHPAKISSLSKWPSSEKFLLMQAYSQQFSSIQLALINNVSISLSQTHWNGHEIVKFPAIDKSIKSFETFFWHFGNVNYQYDFRADDSTVQWLQCRRKFWRFVPNMGTNHQRLGQFLQETEKLCSSMLGETLFCLGSCLIWCHFF